MAQKKMDTRIDLMEQELEMVKEQLHRLLRSMEQLAQIMVRSLQSTEETQKMVVAIAGQRSTTANKGDGPDTRAKGTEGPAGEIAQAGRRSRDKARGTI